MDMQRVRKTRARKAVKTPASRPTEESRRRSVRLVLRRAEKDLARFRIVLTRRRGLNVGENLQSALHGGARRDSVEPLLDSGKLRPVDAVPLARPEPRKNRDIRDGILRASEVPRFREALLHHPVQAPDLVRIAVDGVIDAFGHGVAPEMA